jgi:transposase
VADSGATRLELPAVRGPGAGAERGGDPALEEGTLAGHQKKARAERRTIVFLDESGLSQRPHRVRTWACNGQTPVLEFNFNWKLLSAIAGMTFWNFYFQLFPKAIRSAQVIEFLGHLKRHLRGPLLVIWDRLPAHRSRATQEWVREQGGWIHTEFLPAYAPELPNVCPKDWWELHEGARRTLRRIRRRPRIIAAFWEQSKLPFETRYIMGLSIIQSGVREVKAHGSARRALTGRRTMSHAKVESHSPVVEWTSLGRTMTALKRTKARQRLYGIDRTA